jgi:hypothetical protein
MYQVYADSRHEGAWLKQLSPRLKDAHILEIGQRGANPDAVERLITYDRPDVILLKDGHAILVVEKTREVPTGHNVGQRLARLVRAAELGVPSIYKLPFDAMKHGTYGNVCHINIRLLKAMAMISRIHDVPAVAVSMRVDSRGEILPNAPCDMLVAEMLEAYLPNLEHAAFSPSLEAMRDEYSRRLKVRPSYGSLPPSVSTIKTANARSILGLDVRFPVPRDETVVYTIGMTEAKCRREDPYTGTQFIYDYTLCRVGPRSFEKRRNLVLHFPRIRKGVWLANNPPDPNRKSCNWYLTASTIALADGFIDVRDGQLLNPATNWRRLAL